MKAEQPTRDVQGPCPDPETIAAFLDNRLESATRQGVEAHFAECERCYELVIDAAETEHQTFANSHAAARSRHAMRVVVAAGVLTAAAAVLVLVATETLKFSNEGAASLSAGLTEDATGPAAWRTMRAEVGAQRTTVARLAGFEWGPAPSAFREAPMESRRPPAVLAAAGAVLKAAEREETVEAHHIAGVAYLLLGDFDQAIARLEAGRDNAERPSGLLLSDLAAAYLERGRRRDRAGDLAFAADIAGQAVLQSDAPLEAWFNRALALESLELRDRSRAAWQDYLNEADRRPRRGETAWTEEAREHLHRLVGAGKLSQWPSARERLETGEAFSQAVELSRICTTYPAAVREFAQDVLWPEWGRAVAARLDQKAAATLANIAAIENAMPRSRQQEILADLMARIGRIGPGAAASRQLGAALAAYGEGRRLYEENRVVEAIPLFQRARKGLAPLPLLATWARLYETVDLYLNARWQPLRQALDHVIGEATQYDDPALRGRAWRLAGVAAATQGELAEALNAKRHAREDYERAGDAEERAGIDASLAETTDMAGRRQESWAWLRLAFEGLDHVVRGRREQALFSVAVWNSLRQGLRTLAAEFQLELLHRAERRGEPIGQLEAEVLAARLLRESGRPAAARNHVQRAADQLERIPDPGYRQRAGYELSIEQALVALPSAPKDSVTRLTTLIEAMASSPLQYRSPDLFLARGRAYVALGDSAAARRDFDTGLDIADRLSTGQIVPALRLAIRDSRRSLLNTALDLSIRNNGDGHDGWHLLEQRRGGEIYTTTADRTAPVLDPVEVQRRLDPQTAVVVYATTATALYGWLITSDRYRFAPLQVSPSAVRALGTALRRRLGGDDKGLREVSTRMYDALLGPLLSSTTPIPQRIVLILDEPLHGVPFGLLRRHPGDSPLVTTTVLVRAISARAVSARPPMNARRIAALAIRESLASDAPPLNEALDEARAIAAAYPQGRVLTGPKATVSALWDALGQEDIVHVASHTEIGDEATSRALLMPAGAPSTGKGNPTVRAHLVVLSACSTAEGPDAAGEGPRSLALEFLHVGVRQVVGTLWSVRDRDARQFMTNLHARVARGEDVSSALQRVQAEMAARNAPAESWAPYVAYTR